MKMLYFSPLKVMLSNILGMDRIFCMFIFRHLNFPYRHPGPQGQGFSLPPMKILDTPLKNTREKINLDKHGFCICIIGAKFSFENILKGTFMYCPATAPSSNKFKDFKVKVRRIFLFENILPTCFQIIFD